MNEPLKPATAIPPKPGKGFSVSLAMFLLIGFLLVVWLGFVAFLVWQFVGSTSEPDTRETVTIVFSYPGANAIEVEHQLAKIDLDGVNSNEVAYVESSSIAGHGTVTLYSKPGRGFSESGTKQMQSRVEAEASSWVGKSVTFHEEKAIPNCVILLQPGSDFGNASQVVGFVQSLGDLASVLNGQAEVSEATPHSTTANVVIQVDPEKFRRTFHKQPTLGPQVTKVDAQSIVAQIRTLNFEPPNSNSSDWKGFLESETARTADRDVIVLKNIGSVTTSIDGAVSSFENKPVSVVSIELHQLSSTETRKRIENVVNEFVANSPAISRAELVWLDDSIGALSAPILFRLGHLEPKDVDKISVYFEDRFPQVRATLFSENVAQTNLLISNRDGQTFDRNVILDSFHGIVGDTSLIPVDIRNQDGDLGIRPPIEFALVGPRDHETMRGWAKVVATKLRKHKLIKLAYVQHAMQLKPEIYIELDESKGKEFGLTESFVNENLRFQLGNRRDAMTLQYGRVEVVVSVQQLRKLEDMSRVMVPTGSGAVPLSDVASLRYITSPDLIRNIDGKLAAKISVHLHSDLDRASVVKEIMDVIQSVADELQLEPPEFDALLINH